MPPVPDSGRAHDVSRLTTGELERVQRELSASLALVRPDSPVRMPILAHMSAIDEEFAARAVGIRLCSCGFASDDRTWFEGHLFRYPDHYERSQPRGLPSSP
jgi:hypothetical protein